MARLSNSSSTSKSNGQPPPPANTEVTPANTDETTAPTDSTKSKDDEGYEFDYSHVPAGRGSTLPYDPSLLPRGSRSLSLIGLQAFWLGFTLAGCLLGTVWLASAGYKIWRLPAFFACLSLFHFLEYYVTARYNLPTVRASSFLIWDNKEYNAAHALATLEIVLSTTLLPKYQAWLVWSPLTIALGLALIVVGQSVRSVAMAQAGTNFNHMPVQTRKEDHELVTTGMYEYLRHPSYFGFFWWALGTQVMVGNKVCLLGYAFVLWNFFNRRIQAEEKSLIRFFGKDYEDFRNRTPTGIPFIR